MSDWEIMADPAAPLRLKSALMPAFPDPTPMQNMAEWLNAFSDPAGLQSLPGKHRFGCRIHDKIKAADDEGLDISGRLEKAFGNIDLELVAYSNEAMVFLCQGKIIRLTAWSGHDLAEDLDKTQPYVEPDFIAKIPFNPVTPAGATGKTQFEKAGNDPSLLNNPAIHDAIALDDPLALIREQIYVKIECLPRLLTASDFKAAFGEDETKILFDGILETCKGYLTQKGFKPNFELHASNVGVDPENGNIYFLERGCTEALPNFQPVAKMNAYPQPLRKGENFFPGGLSG